jgi:membrane-associated phospholipid phosphatase
LNGATINKPDRTGTVDTRDGYALSAVAIGLALSYVILSLRGSLLLITKTAILPVLFIYGLAQRERVRFVQDWFPFICGTLCFDAVRGAIYMLVQWDWLPVYADYVIALERFLIGSPAAPLLLQPFRSPLLDYLAGAWYLAHFVMFFGFGLILWHLRREEFWRFRAALLVIMAVGLLGYLVIPTVPPWLAAVEGRIPPISHRVLEHVATPSLLEAFATNPVAAMPSLHIAFPVACARLGWRIFGRPAGFALTGYTLMMAWATMYLGDHYFADVLAGAILGWIGVSLVPSAPGTRWRLVANLALGIAVLALTFALSAVTTANAMRTATESRTSTSSCSDHAESVV